MIIDSNYDDPSQRDTASAGFTMVELLIVIVILGVLATIVAFSVRGVSGKAHRNSCQLDHKLMATAIDSFYAIKGSYPSVDNLATSGVNEAVEDLESVRVMDAVSKRWLYPGGDPSNLVPVHPCTAADVT